MIKSPFAHTPVNNHKQNKSIEQKYFFVIVRWRFTLKSVLVSRILEFGNYSGTCHSRRKFDFSLRKDRVLNFQ